MTRIFLTLPVAMLMCGAAFAETAGLTTEKGESEAMTVYGTTWSEAIGSTFYSDPEMSTMRSQDEVSTTWLKLSQEDRDSVIAECARYSHDTGNAAAADTAATTAGTDAATSGTMTATAGVTGENMEALCDLVETF